MVIPALMCHDYDLPAASTAHLVGHLQAHAAIMIAVSGQPKYAMQKTYLQKACARMQLSELV